ncbi:Ig-like domain-containing protein [Paenibacillus sp. G2S3]|uniref:Ig-like domain-containing protein n=1 Tax=Paenibacillus sp. G2S3 TaxID=3047872 RepID=UPI0024C0FDDC|nr:Ig-like domain-containing protein [Paenibacillus sp. G2S3]WHY19105.1 Ig-like domain-containing protein [Paenibacillus sp. G2S3]
MKKILSVALSTAMAFSMFASVAFGDAAATPQQKFDALAAKGILNGYPDGKAHLEKDLTRAEFAKIVTKLFDLTEVTNKLSYKDKGYNASNWAVPYIEAVTAANLMQGKDTVKGIFDYNGKVTVEEVAAVLFRALKLETPATSDNSASAWAKGYAQAVIDAGLIAKDTNFKANASRSLVVETAYAVDQLKAAPTVASAEAVSPTSVVVTFSDKTTTTVTLTTALVEGVETSISFKHNNHDYTTKVTLAAPKVLSVEAPNAKQLVVKFNRAISADSLIEDGKLIADAVKVVPVNGTAVTVAGSSASLNEAGTELTITFNKVETDYLKGQYTVVVSDSVLTAAGTKVAAYTNLLTVADTVAPTVKAINSVAKESTKEVFVQFSEPVKQYGFTATVNGVFATVTRESADTFKLTTTTALKSGSVNDVAFNKVTDFAGNVASTLKTSVTVVADTAAPTIVSVTPESDQYVNVKFNKKVNIASFKGNVSLLRADGDKVGNMSVVTTDTESDTVKLQVPSNFSFPSSGTFTGTLQFQAAVRDTLGNTLGSAVTQAVTLVKDTTAPTVVSATYGSTGIVLTFSEDVVLATGSISVIDESTGAVVGNSINQANMTVKGAKVTVKTATTLSGDYTVRITAGLVKDKAKAPNSSEAATVALTAEKLTTNDDKRPTVTSVVYETTSSQPGYHQFTVTAKDNVGLNVASLRDVSSYVLNGVALPSGSYPVVASIGANDSATKPATAVVNVFIPLSGITTTKDYKFEVVGISDAAGNGLDTTTAASATAKLKNTTAPKLTEAVINSVKANYLTLKFTNDIKFDAKVSAADFVVSIGVDGKSAQAATFTVEPGTATDAGKLHLVITGLADGTAITDLNTVDSLVVKVSDAADFTDGDLNVVVKDTSITVR